jgi:hypothetical protein
MATLPDNSVIMLVEKMIADNLSDENIVSNLATMGIQEEQAKQFILMAKSDTLSILKSEIEKIVSEDLNRARKDMSVETDNFVERKIGDAEKQIESNFEKELTKAKIILSDTQMRFQESANQLISNITQMGEKNSFEINEAKRKIASLEAELINVKSHGLSNKSRIIKIVLAAFAVVCFMAAIGFVIVNYINTPNVDYITYAVVLALVGTATAYLSTGIQA